MEKSVTWKSKLFFSWHCKCCCKVVFGWGDKEETRTSIAQAGDWWASEERWGCLLESSRLVSEGWGWGWLRLDTWIVGAACTTNTGTIAITSSNKHPLPRPQLPAVPRQPHQVKEHMQGQGGVFGGHGNGEHVLKRYRHAPGPRRLPGVSATSRVAAYASHTQHGYRETEPTDSDAGNRSPEAQQEGLVNVLRVEAPRCRAKPQDPPQRPPAPRSRSTLLGPLLDGFAELFELCRDPRVR